MKNGLTEMVFIIDGSGSMAGLESDTIGGFNAMIKKQKEEDGPAYVSTIFFNGESKVIHDRVAIGEVGLLTDTDYKVCGCTALIDAIGDAIHHISNVHKYARPEDVPEHTVFAITTDGMENASHKYSSDEIKRRIEELKEERGWEFVFIGANIDAVDTARNYGINKKHSVNYIHDRRGTAKNYEAMSMAVTSLRRYGVIDDDWKMEIEKDYQSRKKSTS